MVSRKTLNEEYGSFKKDIQCKLKKAHPQIAIFGSYARGKKSPNDIDIRIDVGQMTDAKFRSTKKLVSKIRRKYPHVDPVLYSWPTKRLPSKSKMNSVRWKENYWEEYPSIGGK